MPVSAERRAPRFHELTLSDVRQETPDSVSLAFEIPADVRPAFRFIPGQYLTLRAEIEGEDVRRPYSICSGLTEPDLRVAIRLVSDGVFSTYAHKGLAAGDRLQVMEPDGRFLAVPDADSAHYYVGFAAGSGITPIMSIVKSILEIEKTSRFALFYGNREAGTVMFREALEDLKNRYPARFSLLHVLSREAQEIELQNGRIDAAKCQRIFDALVAVGTVDSFYLCGPEAMTAGIRAALSDRGVGGNRIHTELFTPAPETRARERLRRKRDEPASAASQDSCEVTVILDGVSTTLRVPRDGESILDASLRLRPDMPYACKGGMCCTCRARLVSGEVDMDVNYTLADDEIGRGFVLTCQSHPRTERVVLDYDSR